MMYRVMVTFDPMQCVATPLDSLTQQPRPSYERAWLPATDDQAGDDGSLPTRGTQFLSERKINYSLLWNNTHPNCFTKCFTHTFNIWPLFTSI